MKKFILFLMLTATNIINAADFRKNIAKIMNDAIAVQDIPGGVVLVMHKAQKIYHEAFGNLMVTPEVIPANKNALYDLASITKLFTATLIMQLHDEGLLDVTKPVSHYLPSFRSQDKTAITIEHLLTHRSGLPVIIPTRYFEKGLAFVVNYIGLKTPLVSAPGTGYLYSDLGPIIASYIAEKVTKKKIDSLLEEYIYLPLNLKNTLFSPALSRPLELIAPTNTEDGELRHGLCWSPRSKALGGIGGSSGLFSTANDLAVFCQLFLNNGVYKDKQILSPESVKLMTTARKELPLTEKRGIGFDINTDSSCPRGRSFNEDSFGHTGVSGTSLWIDPTLQTTVIILTNRSHPTITGNLKEIRNKIATLVGNAVKNKSY